MSDKPKWQVVRLDDIGPRGRAIGQLPRFREQARRDDDFAAVRDDPRFEQAL